MTPPDMHQLPDDMPRTKETPGPPPSATIAAVVIGAALMIALAVWGW